MLGAVISLRTDKGVETLTLEDFEARVKSGDIAPSTPVRFAVLTGDRWVDARDLEVFRRLNEPARIYFSRQFSLGRFPAITVVFVLLQVVLFFGVAGGERVLSLDTLISVGAKVPANIVELGETWRLITANVLHRDVLHLVFNMFFLFNVGGTIENAYRKQDYILVLVMSALGTTLLSTMMSPIPSVGASGIVLGLFGAATVFAYKYAEILPRKYRRYLTGAVLPYAMFVLYVGLATPQTDNWGHFGGLIGGIAAALPLEPRLLRPDDRRMSFVLRNLPALGAIGLLATTLALGPVVRRMDPSLTELVDRDSGLRVKYPARWAFGQNHLGYASWGNSLGASIGLRARRESRQPLSLGQLKRRFLEEELARHAADGDITAVKVLQEGTRPVDGGRAVELIVSLTSRAGAQVTRNILIERGYYSYYVVLSAPVPFAEQYTPIFDEVVAAVQLVRPAAVERAQTVVSTFPGMSSAHVDLGDQLASIGEVEGAAGSYKQALAALPEHHEALYGLAKLAVDYGGDAPSAEAIASRLHERKPDDIAIAALLSDLRERLGQIDGARAVLVETLDRSPEATELRERLIRLDGRQRPSRPDGR